MDFRDRVLESVYRAIREVNDQVMQEDKIEISPDTVLVGSGTNVDSIGLVNLIAMAEKNIEDEFSVTLTLADERAMLQKTSPFKTVSSLVDYIVVLLEVSDG